LMKRLPRSLDKAEPEPYKRAFGERAAFSENARLLV
jgi:hypothetical protein